MKGFSILLLASMALFLMAVLPQVVQAVPPPPSEKSKDKSSTSLNEDPVFGSTTTVPKEKEPEIKTPIPLDSRQRMPLRKSKPGGIAKAVLPQVVQAVPPPLSEKSKDRSSTSLNEDPVFGSTTTVPKGKNPEIKSPIPLLLPSILLGPPPKAPLRKSKTGGVVNVVKTRPIEGKKAKWKNEENGGANVSPDANSGELRKTKTFAHRVTSFFARTPTVQDDVSELKKAKTTARTTTTTTTTTGIYDTKTNKDNQRPTEFTYTPTMGLTTKEKKQKPTINPSNHNRIQSTPFNYSPLGPLGRSYSTQHRSVMVPNRQNQKSSKPVGKEGPSCSLIQDVFKEDFNSCDPQPFVEKCTLYLKNYLEIEGVGRIPGNAKDNEALKQTFIGDPNADIKSDTTPFVVVDTLKSYFRDNDGTIFKPEEGKKLLELLGDGGSHEEKQTEEVLALLRKGYNSDTARKLLEEILSFLHKQAGHSDVNKMTSNNLAIIWGPTLLHTPEYKKIDGMTLLNVNQKICNVLTWMIDNVNLVVKQNVSEKAPEGGKIIFS